MLRLVCAPMDLLLGQLPFPSLFLPLFLPLFLSL